MGRSLLEISTLQFLYGIPATCHLNLNCAACKHGLLYHREELQMKLEAAQLSGTVPCGHMEMVIHGWSYIDGQWGNWWSSWRWLGWGTALRWDWCSHFIQLCLQSCFDPIDFSLSWIAQCLTQWNDVTSLLKSNYIPMAVRCRYQSVCQQTWLDQTLMILDRH